MKIKMNRPILGEQRIERVLAKGVRVRAAGGEDHQVCYVYDAYSEIGDTCTEEGGSGNDFERYFYANAY